MPLKQNQSQIDAIFNNNPMAPMGDKVNALTDVVNELSNEEMRTANPNIKGNLLYGYGNPALSFRGEEYPWIPGADERDVPENQDTLMWHFIDKPELLHAMSQFMGGATPEEKNQLAREFTLLRNASDYSRQRNLDQFVDDQRQRNLYGDTLVDLLQNSPEGQSILGTTAINSRSANPDERFISRQRNIAGQGTGAFIK